MTLRSVPDQPPEFLTYDELASLLRCSVKTVERMKKAGMPYKTWGRRRVVFDRVEAVRWAEKQKRRDAA